MSNVILPLLFHAEKKHVHRQKTEKEFLSGRTRVVALLFPKKNYSWEDVHSCFSHTFAYKKRTTVSFPQENPAARDTSLERAIKTGFFYFRRLTHGGFPSLCN